MADIQNLHPTVRKATEELIRRANARLTGPYQVRITQGFRSFAEQNALYAQGRTKPGSIVTNAKGGQSNHNYGLAIDFCLVTRDGRSVTWDMNSDFDGDGKADWMEVVEEAKKLGFEWGGDWTGFKDYPHFEMTFGLSIRDLQNGKRPPNSAVPPTGGGSTGGGGGGNTFTPHPTKNIVYITGTNVRLRKGPGTNYEEIRKLNAPEDYEVFEVRGEWLNLGGNQWVKNDPSFAKYVPAAGSKPSGGGSPKEDGTAIVPYPGYYIEYGVKDTKNVQRVQRAVGVNPDGIFGTATKEAVKAYQSRHGLYPDGVVGLRTWNMMF